MAAVLKTIKEIIPDEADDQDHFPRVPPSERGEYLAYLMRRATWSYGVGLCVGTLVGAAWGAAFPGLY